MCSANQEPICGCDGITYRWDIALLFFALECFIHLSLENAIFLSCLPAIHVLLIPMVLAWRVTARVLLLHQLLVATPAGPPPRQTAVAVSFAHCQLGHVQASVTHNEVNADLLEEIVAIFTHLYVAATAGHTTMNVELVPQELMYAVMGRVVTMTMPQETVARKELIVVSTYWLKVCHVSIKYSLNSSFAAITMYPQQAMAEEVSGCAAMDNVSHVPALRWT